MKEVEAKNLRRAFSSRWQSGDDMDDVKRHRQTRQKREYFPNKATPENKIDGPVAMFIAMSRLLVNGGGEVDFLSTIDPDEDLLLL